jgi:hypothetical protein
MSRAFPSKFHCILEKELPRDSFEVNKVSYDVPCVFQIWEKKDIDRPKSTSVKEKGFQYVKECDVWHIAFGRVGGRAGTCYLKGTGDYSLQSHYFLKLDAQYIPNIQKIIDKVNRHVFPSNTVGPRSLSKGEANQVLNLLIENSST